tara:strand:+ start:188 stop:571 length:384 start_codon:yes stop_codon:yes gene_type:complete
MGHYAFLNVKNEVIRVITGVDEGSEGRTIEEIEESYESFSKLKCKKTSYNTMGGVHLLGKTPYRKNYAGVGYTFDEVRDAFIPPKQEGLDSWILDEETCLWKAPVEYPNDGKVYRWNEESQKWILLD